MTAKVHIDIMKELIQELQVKIKYVSHGRDLLDDGEVEMVRELLDEIRRSNEITESVVVGPDRTCYSPVYINDNIE